MGTPDEGMKDEGGKVERDRGVDLCLSVGGVWYGLEAVRSCAVASAPLANLRFNCCLKVKLWWLGACRG